MQQRTILDYFVITLKGMAMGAADVVPGVSGGTMAFITGIYEELLTSISSVNFKLFRTLKNDGISAVWKAVNGNFLAALLLGIGISVVSLAKFLSYLLENQPILLWSFFFGLVLASVLYVGKQIAKWSVITVLLFLLGAFLAYYITTLQPLVSESSSALFLFIAGALAICAMILPGISGAFILVLLGAYKFVLDAVHTRDLQLLAIIGVGAVVGLLSFSRILKWLFNHYKDLTLAVLTGFILGSLNKIWPWKEVLKTTVIEGKVIILKEQSISPLSYQGENQLFLSIFLGILGFAVIIILEKVAKKYE